MVINCSSLETSLDYLESVVDCVNNYDKDQFVVTISLLQDAWFYNMSIFC